MERVQRPEPEKQKSPRLWVERTGVNENQMRKDASKQKHTSQVVQKKKRKVGEPAPEDNMS